MNGIRDMIATINMGALDSVQGLAGALRFVKGVCVHFYCYCISVMNTFTTSGLLWHTFSSIDPTICIVDMIQAATRGSESINHMIIKLSEHPTFQTLSSPP